MLLLDYRLVIYTVCTIFNEQKCIQTTVSSSQVQNIVREVDAGEVNVC